MGLRDREQRELAEIEQHLAEDDPTLAAKLANTAPATFRPSRRTLIVFGVLVTYVTGLMAMIAGAMISSVVFVAVGVGLTASVFGGLIWWAWRNRHG